MFATEFMRRAIFVSLLVALITPLIGSILVFKGMSNIGEALSHNCLAGIAFGLLIGINPLIGAILFSLAAALSIEGFSKLFPGFQEIATTVILSLGIGLAAIFSGFIQNAATLNSFLFGSIVAIADIELYLTLALTPVVIISYFLLYPKLFAITFDEEYARLQGVRIKAVNFSFMLLTAITVSLASRTVGALIVSSLMVIPVACSLKLAKSYRMTVIFAVLFALLFSFSGLILSYYLDLRPSGTIVLLGVLTLLLISLWKRR